jgi:hypothetical protein
MKNSKIYIENNVRYDKKINNINDVRNYFLNEYAEIYKRLRKFMFEYKYCYNDELFLNDPDYNINEDEIFYKCLKGLESNSKKLENIDTMYKLAFIHILLSTKINIYNNNINKKTIEKISHLKYEFYKYLKYIKLIILNTKEQEKKNYSTIVQIKKNIIIDNKTGDLYKFLLEYYKNIIKFYIDLDYNFDSSIQNENELENKLENFVIFKNYIISIITSKTFIIINDNLINILYDNEYNFEFFDNSSIIQEYKNNFKYSIIDFIKEELTIIYNKDQNELNIFYEINLYDSLIKLCNKIKNNLKLINIDNYNDYANDNYNNLINSYNEIIEEKINGLINILIETEKNKPCIIEKIGNIPIFDIDSFTEQVIKDKLDENKNIIINQEYLNSIRNNFNIKINHYIFGDLNMEINILKELPNSDCLKYIFDELIKSRLFSIFNYCKPRSYEKNEFITDRLLEYTNIIIELKNSLFDDNKNEFKCDTYNVEIYKKKFKNNFFEIMRKSEKLFTPNILDFHKDDQDEKKGEIDWEYYVPINGKSLGEYVYKIIVNYNLDGYNFYQACEKKFEIFKDKCLDLLKEQNNIFKNEIKN